MRTASIAAALLGLGASPALAAPGDALPVTSQVEAEHHLQLVRNQMAGWGLTLPYGPIPMRLVDQATLNGHSHGGSTLGLTRKKWSTRDDVVVSRDVDMLFLHGMSRAQFEAVAAHELMHAWMFLDGQADHADALEEGVCNLAGYYVYQANGSKFALDLRERMFRSKNPWYGEGMRRAIRYVQRHEFKGLIVMLRANHDFPAGY